MNRPNANVMFECTQLNALVQCADGTTKHPYAAFAIHTPTGAILGAALSEHHDPLRLFDETAASMIGDTSQPRWVIQGEQPDDLAPITLQLGRASELMRLTEVFARHQITVVRRGKMAGGSIERVIQAFSGPEFMPHRYVYLDAAGEELNLEFSFDDDTEDDVDWLNVTSEFRPEAMPLDKLSTSIKFGIHRYNNAVRDGGISRQDAWEKDRESQQIPVRGKEWCASLLSSLAQCGSNQRGS